MTPEQIALLLTRPISPNIHGTPDAEEWARWVRYVAGS